MRLTLTSTNCFLGKSAEVPHQVAFFVGLYDNLGPITDHADIVFDRVVTNVGSGYEPSTGRFTAPVSATYQFNVTISAGGTGSKVKIT